MRADRLITLLLYLQINGKVTTTHLAGELGVSRRTILRDIQSLSEAGIPIYTQSGDGGGVGLDENYRFSLTGLHDSEVRALFVSGNLRLLADIGLESAFERLTLKVLAALPTPHQQAADEVRQRILVDSQWWIHSKAPLALTVILQALNRDQIIQVTYQNSTGQIAERTLEPYGLVAKAGNWYLVALRDDDFRTYRVSRIQDVRFSGKGFIRQRDFDLHAFWHSHMDSFLESLLTYRFTLKVRPHRMDFVRTHSTGTFEVVSSPDELEWVTVRFTAEGLDPAAMLVFGLGNDAIVMEPLSLAEAIAARCRDLLRGSMASG